MDKKKILIIDDECNFTKIVKLNLEGTGKYEVREENKGANGLSAARDFRPDLIFLDILMTDMEGSEVVCELENDRQTRDIPVIFLTAVVTKEEVTESSGVIGKRPFIAKPVDTQQLIDAIEKTISG